MKNINFAFNIIHLLNTMFKNFKVVKSERQGDLKLWYLTGTTAKEEIYVKLIPRH